MCSLKGMVLSRLMSAAAVAVALLAASGAEAAGKQCCFNNPGFTGTCKVTIEQGEKCSTVLEYLNTPNTSGRDYCSNSGVRGGWVRVNCPTTDQEGSGATPTKPNLPMLRDNAGSSKRTPTPAADGATPTPRSTPTPGT